MDARAPLPSYAQFAVALAIAIGFAWASEAAARRTVCTITVNSPDEREVFRRTLPEGDYAIVELVERGRPDWLDAACRSAVRCDVLVVSGHFDGGTEFYSDRLDQGESLPVETLQRAACSGGCPGLFASLKEVYLFGCNTLNGDATTSTAEEVERMLVRGGASAHDAAHAATLLNQQHARSNHDRMRMLFKEVPVLYGFSTKAPLGRVAGPVLERHLRSSAARHEIGSGRVDVDLLQSFAAAAMTFASGMTDADPLAGHRNDVCGFVDQRASLAQRAAFVHRVLRREAGNVRMLLDPIETFAAALPHPAKRPPDVTRAMQGIARDDASRGRFLAYMQGVDDALTRSRMIDVAHRLGWLTADERRAEIATLLRDRLLAQVAVADIDLACRLNGDGGLDAEGARLRDEAKRGAPQAAMLACLGDAEARQLVIDALARGRDADADVAQVLLHHRPLADAKEVRHVASSLERMASTEALTRALAALAARPLVDDATYATLTRLFPATRSLAVQRAIAGVLVRSDYDGADRREVAGMLLRHRIHASERDVIDVLIRRLAR